MTYEEKIDMICNLAQKDNNSIKAEKISEYFEEGSDEYFRAIDEIISKSINVISDEATSDDNVSGLYKGNSTRIYLNEIGTVKLLTAEEENELSKLIIEGKEASQKLEEIDENEISSDEYNNILATVEKGAFAKNKLVSANLRLVVSVAKRYIGRGLPLDDLIQAGNMGLLRAADKYDYKLGYRFSTYSNWWIKQAIIRTINETVRTIRVPGYVNDSIIKFNRAKSELFKELNREPTIKEIADRLGFEQSKVVEIMQLLAEPDRLDKEVGEDRESSLGDFIPADQESPYRYTVNQKVKSEVAKYLKVLTEREQYVMIKRYGFENQQAMTLEEIGKSLGISREAVRQIIARAIRKIKASDTSGNLKSLWEELLNGQN